MPPKTFTLKLGGRELHFQWSNSMAYRLSLIKLEPQRTYGFIVQVLWAGLVPSEAADWPTPESFAALVDLEKAQEYFEVCCQLTPPKKKAETPEAAAKNEIGSTA